MQYDSCHGEARKSIGTLFFNVPASTDTQLEGETVESSGAL